MNRIIFILLSFFAQFSISAQNAMFTQIKQLINEKHPEIELSQKLIGFVVWSSSDITSRDCLKSFNKTVTVYNQARLKGGLQGIEIIAINRDNLSSEALVVLEKEKITKLIPVKLEELNGVEIGQIKNVIFDSSGNEVYRNLTESTIFSSINKLITR